MLSLLTQEQYIRYEKHREILEDNLRKKLTATGTSFDSVRISGITEKGVDVSTEYAHCGGCGTDYDDYSFTWAEVAMPVEDWVVYNKKQIAAKKLADEALKAEALRQKKEQEKAAKEEADRKKYLELKAKFEGEQ